MQIKIHYPVHAKGTPKGLKNERRIYGSIFEYFDIPEADDDFVPLLTVEPHNFKGQPEKKIEYVLSSDGVCYRKFALVNHGGVPTIPAFHLDHNNPVAADALVKHASTFTAVETLKDHFPLELKRDAHRGYELLSLDPKTIKNLAILSNDREIKALRQAVSDLIIIKGELHKRVPEPVYAVTINHDKKVESWRWILPGFLDLEQRLQEEWDNYRKRREVVGLFAIDDRERMTDFATEITAKIGGRNLADRDLGLGFELFDQPLAGTSYNLKVLSQRMLRSATDSLIVATSGNTAVERILSWTSETMDLFRQLDTVQSSPKWAKDTAALETIVRACMEYDDTHSYKVFTRPYKDIDHSFNREVWLEYQMSSSFGDSPRF